MCGRYTNTAGIDEINDHLGVPLKDDAGTRRFNIAPTEEVLALVAPNGEVEPRLLRWGLVPSWSKVLKGASRLINARMESLASSPVYRGLIGKGSRRALQVADGYFEWLKPERRGEPRQPFFFQVDGGVPFAFASLWTLAKIDSQWVGSVVLLTCDASPNRVAQGIHDRMPVILADRAAQEAWLSSALDASEALELCGALPASRLYARPANPALNRVGEAAEGPGLLSLPAGSGEHLDPS